MSRLGLALVWLMAASAFSPSLHAEDAKTPPLQMPELDRGEVLEKLGFPAVTERLTGWTKFGKGKVYTLPIKAGQHVKITFASKSQYAFMAIFDLTSSADEAFFGTDEDGMTADVTVSADTTWFIKPYYSRVTRRRGLGAPYSILIEPLAPGLPQQSVPATAPDKAPSLFPPRPDSPAPAADRPPSLFPPKPPAQ
jgi:hypothetical protein